MRAILAQVEPQFPGVKLGLTGLPVLETDEMELSDVGFDAGIVAGAPRASRCSTSSSIAASAIRC